MHVYGVRIYDIYVVSKQTVWVIFCDRNTVHASTCTYGQNANSQSHETSILTCACRIQTHARRPWIPRPGPPPLW